MTVTLLTAVPRTGKTSYAVWDYIKPAVESGRAVYVLGIPKLSLPHIKIDKEFIYRWHEREYDPDIEEEKLLHIPPGALIVIDEAWSVWPAGGVAKAHESIQHLAMHGHYGIDFLLITQKPHLMHTAALAQVSVHQHILKKWSGLKLLEWPEYVNNPSVRSNRNDAIVINFNVRKEAFPLYHSGQHHSKLNQKKPPSFYFSLIMLLILPIAFFVVYDKVINRSGDSVTLVQDDSKPANDPKQSFILPVSDNSKSDPISSEPIYLEPINQIVRFESVVPKDYDWSEVGSCLKSKERGCICYGRNGSRLLVPLPICESAVEYGWPNNPPLRS